METQKTKIKKKIIYFMKHNYFLKSKDLTLLMSKLDYLPLKALNNFLEILQEADEKQKEIFHKLISSDKGFFSGLTKFVDREYFEATKQITKKESEDAESILDEF